MKFFKGIVATVALCTVSNVFSEVKMVEKNTIYRNYIDNYRGEVITRDNNISFQWVQGAVNTLRQAGFTVNLQDPVQFNYIARVLWEEIMQQGLRYYSGSQEMVNRLWQSLNGSLDELRRSTSAQRPLPQTPRILPQPSRDQLESAGIAALRNFRLQTAETIKNTPTYFYSAGSLQQSWLREALRLVLNNNQLKLNQSNMRNIKSEITLAVEELMKQLLRNDPRNLSQRQKDAIIQTVRIQVEQFIKSQPMARL
jgi:hypothetical protein